MSGTDDTRPTSIRALAAGGADDGELVAEMTDRLAPAGLSEGQIPGPHRLLRATYRALDSQILSTALGCLDQDVATPVARWLATYRDLRTAAERTIEDGDHRETVTLRKPTRLTATQNCTVVVRVGETDLVTFPFELAVAMDFGETTALLRAGAIQVVIVEALELTVELTFADAPPLWKGAARPLAVELPVRPGVVVPLVDMPRPRSPSDPRRITGRPPVPGRNSVPPV